MSEYDAYKIPESAAVGDHRSTGPSESELSCFGAGPVPNTDELRKFIAASQAMTTSDGSSSPVADSCQIVDTGKYQQGKTSDKCPPRVGNGDTSTGPLRALDDEWSTDISIISSKLTEIVKFDKTGTMKLSTGDTLIRVPGVEVLVTPGGDTLVVNKDGSFDLGASKGVKIKHDRESGATKVMFSDGAVVAIVDGRISAVKRGLDAARMAEEIELFMKPKDFYGDPGFFIDPGFIPRSVGPGFFKPPQLENCDPGIDAPQRHRNDRYQDLEPKPWITPLSLPGGQQPNLLKFRERLDIPIQPSRKQPADVDSSKSSPAPEVQNKLRDLLDKIKR